MLDLAVSERSMFKCATVKYEKGKVKVPQSCPTLWDPMDYRVYGILQARILEGVAVSLSRGVFPTQGSNPGLLHHIWILYQLRHKVSPRTLEWVAYPFSKWLFLTQDSNQGLCIASGFFTNWFIREAPTVKYSFIHFPP